MFNQLFVRSEALTRQLSAPLIEERCQFLTHCAVQGMTKSTLEAKARLLLSIAEYLEMKAKALATCEIRGAVPPKHWKDDVTLMQFLRSL
jgi:hypothetical protein